MRWSFALDYGAARNRREGQPIYDMLVGVSACIISKLIPSILMRWCYGCLGPPNPRGVCGYKRCRALVLPIR